MTEGIWFDPVEALLRKRINEDWTDRHRNVLKIIVVEGDGCKKRYEVAGRMKTNVKDATKKAPRNTVCMNVRFGRKLEVRSQRNHGNGSNEQEHQRKTGNDTEESRRVL